MVLSNGADFFCAILFSPPYGDGTKFGTPRWLLYSFSPPYGDCTKSCAIWLDGRLFSPPYGDSTDETFGYQEAWAFPSPCGEKLKSGTRTLMAWQRSFRPLAGQPHYTTAVEQLKSLFRASHSGGSLQRRRCCASGCCRPGRWSPDSCGGSRRPAWGCPRLPDAGLPGTQRCTRPDRARRPG